jgi:predicted RNA-binding protein
MSMVDIIVWREPGWATTDLIGHEVEATDGKVGKVDEKTTLVQNQGFVVVDTGPWILGKKVMLPAGIIQSVDLDEQKLYVERTKDEIKNAPEFDEATFQQSAYQNQIGSHYSRSGVTR